MSVVDIYGKGIKVVMRSDGSLDTIVTGSGDFKMVDGKENLINRVILRLSIRKGEIESDPELGSDLHQLRGLPATQLTFEWIKVLTYDALIKDPAIRDIENLVVTTNPSVKGQVIIAGNIISVTNFKQVIDEPHNYVEDADIYELNYEHVRILTEVKAIVHGNLIYLVQDQDYRQVGDGVEFISDVVPDGGFLVSYQFYDVQETKKQEIPFNAPYNLAR